MVDHDDMHGRNELVFIWARMDIGSEVVHRGSGHIAVAVDGQAVERARAALPPEVIQSLVCSC